MDYKRFLLNINFYFLFLVVFSGLFIENNIFYLVSLFFIFINLKDYFIKIITFNLNTLLYFILTTIILTIEIINFNSNYSLLMFLFLFKRHDKNNFAYLNYYMNKFNIQKDSFSCITNKKNEYKIYFKNYILVIEPAFSGIVFNDNHYKIESINRYAVDNNKELFNLNETDFEIISILDY